MPDDWTAQVRQIAQYPSALPGPGDVFLFQQGGIGGGYRSVGAPAMFQAALDLEGWLQLAPAPEGGIAFNGASLSYQGGVLTFTETFQAQTIVGGEITVGGIPVANQTMVTELFDAVVANSVWSFNGRRGEVQLTTDDIRRAGGVPNVNPAFFGTVTAPTSWNLNACDDTVATTAWVQQAIINAGNVGNMVRSFNGRGGCVVMTAHDVTIGATQPGQFAQANTPPAGDTSLRIANTSFVDGAVTDVMTWATAQFETYSQIIALQYAPINSPQFTGIPTAPTPAQTVNSGQLATTAFVHQAVTASTTGVSSWNGRTGAVTLTTADVTGAGGAPLASPAFTGTPTGVTAAPGDSTIKLATTAFVEAAVAASTAGVSSFNTRTGAVTLQAADVTAVGGALLASPAFSGSPTAPTPVPATNNTQLATTAYVTAAIGAITAPVTSFNGRTGAVTFQGSDISAAGGALLASPAFTGAPTSTTAAPGTNTTQIATTAFVEAAVAASTAGVSTWNGRTGAVTMTTADITTAGGAVLASPTFTGTPAAPTATAGTNSTQLATTAFVQAALSAAPGGVSSFNSRTGAITLLASDISAAGGAVLASPNFTGNPTAPTQGAGTNNTTLATTQFVANALAAGGGVTSWNGRAGVINMGAADIIAASGAIYAQADTAPTVGANNTLWFDSIHGQLYVQYKDPITSAYSWVSANNFQQNPSPPPYNYLSGFALSNDSTTPATVLDIAPGHCADSANTTSIVSGSVITKTLAAWAAGSGNGGLGVALAASTWYHVYAALVNGVTDVFFDTAYPPTHPPTGTTASRRIGSFKTNASSQITAFLQQGDYFFWALAVQDVANVATQSTTPVLYTVSTPLGLVTGWLGSVYGANSSNQTAVRAYSPSITTPASVSENAAGAALAATMYSAVGAAHLVGPMGYPVLTNLSSQIYGLSAMAQQNFSINTAGWIDWRGR